MYAGDDDIHDESSGSGCAKWTQARDRSLKHQWSSSGVRARARRPQQSNCTTPVNGHPKDSPVYVPGIDFLTDLTIAPCLRPDDVFLPLMEGKWIYHFDPSYFGYVSGSGSWVVTRHLAQGEQDVIPQFFMNKLDSDSATRSSQAAKFCFRDVTSDERSFICAAIEARLPCGNQLPILYGSEAEKAIPHLLLWASSFTVDFLARLISTGHINRFILKQIPCPLTWPSPQSFNAIRPSSATRALYDAMAAELFELTPAEYAYILSTFPLLDRDQPPLPGDHRVRPTNKGIDRRRQSFITRDLALLTYFDYLADRLDVKPDTARVSRICPDGVPEPPTDIVAFFAEAGVDISGVTDRAVAETGPIRDLRERVRLARELGAVAYVPTIDRRRASFVERAAEAGGLSPDEGVLTPEMAQRVLHDKAERDARWQRAMAIWDNQDEPDREDSGGHRKPPAGDENRCATGTRLFQ